MQKKSCKEILKAVGASKWDLSNKILYEMCQKHPFHKTDEEIIAKVLMIGRIYSAAIERRRQVNSNSSMFYLHEVAPIMRKSKIDIWLTSLKDFENPNYENCDQIIAIHKRVTDLFENISGLGKRSLASKYLHFHFPDLFFIYDLRSSNTLRRMTKSPVWNSNFIEYDTAYARFFLRCLNLIERVHNECGIYLTPRELDKYLLS